MMCPDTGYLVGLAWQAGLLRLQRTGGRWLVELRPFRRDELEIWQRFATDPDAVGEFNWTGFRSSERAVERFEQDGMLSPERSELAVVDEGQIVGVVQWVAGGYDGSSQGWCWRIGCTLLPEHRGRGIGTEAQRLLVEYLFATTPAVRIEADTDVDNRAERACLEKIGFTQEGVLRRVGFRAGSWRDVVRYSLLRGEI